MFHLQLSSHASRLDNEALGLLGSLLHFQSKNRVTASNAMKHRYFHSLGTRVHKLPYSESSTAHYMYIALMCTVQLACIM